MQHVILMIDWRQLWYWPSCRWFNNPYFTSHVYQLKSLLCVIMT